MIKLTILGNNSALPAHGRHPTAQIIEIKEQLFLMDCGEGTQIQMQHYKIKRSRINHIFISHMHGDHYYGLIGLITTMGLLGRTEPLFVYGPGKLKEILDVQMSVTNFQLPYPFLFHEIAPEEISTLVETRDYVIRCFPVEHRIPCHGFSFTLKNKGLKIDPAKCREFEIPTAYYNELKKGADYTTKNGKVIENRLVTLAPPPEKTYAYCADTRYTESFIPYIKGADLLYHESTFLKADGEKAMQRFHSTTEHAALIAKKAEVKRLLLGHYSSRYKELESFYLEAKDIFQNVEISREGMTYEI